MQKKNSLFEFYFLLLFIVTSLLELKRLGSSFRCIMAGDINSLNLLVQTWSCSISNRQG